MPFQKVEFEFPEGEAADEGTVEHTTIDVEDTDAVNIEELDIDEAPVVEEEAEEEEEEVEVEIVDDIPPADRGKVPATPPEDITEDELENYSAKVRNRIKHFSKGYHDERRAKEQAVRETVELQSIVQNLMNENTGLKSTVEKDREALVAQARATLNNDEKKARVNYKEAYEEGDPDRLLAAQEELTETKLTKQRLESLVATPVQSNPNVVQQPQQAAMPPRAKPDAKALDWQGENSWFGHEDHEPETAFAIGIHKKMVEREGISPETDDYYSRLNASMHDKFPELFGNTLETGRGNRRTTSNVVAPATRSMSAKKIKLTPTQYALSKRLGLTPAQYAKQAALDMRKQNG